MYKSKPAHLAGKLIEILPATAVLRCEFCGEFTWWWRAQQHSWGTCPDCAGTWYWQPPLDLADAIGNVISVFGAIEVGELQPTPAGYVGPDAGPCRKCHRSTLLYGGYGFPYCRDCWETRHAAHAA